MTESGYTPPTARQVVTAGVDVRAVILRFRKLNLRTDTGRIYEFIFLVKPPSAGNFLLQVGNPVPPEAVPLIVPGRELPAKLHKRDRRALVVDWVAAIAEGVEEDVSTDGSGAVRDNM